MNKRLALAIDHLQRLPDARQLDAAAVLEAFIVQDAPRPAWTADQIEVVAFLHNSQDRAVPP